VEPYPEEFYTIALPWLTSRIIQKVRVRTFTDPNTGKPWDIKLWVLWHARHGFVHVWPWNCPVGGMICRRISIYQLRDWKTYPRAEQSYVFDPDGDGVWMDFLWAPGQKLMVQTILERIGVDWVGWEHKKTRMPHIKSIKQIGRILADHRGILVV
jgi:hypothetical protein